MSSENIGTLITNALISLDDNQVNDEDNSSDSGSQPIETNALAGAWRLARVPAHGFLHDIRHENRDFCLQTEDMGIYRATVVTHIFCGGRVIATKRTNYSEWLDSTEMQNKVREIMRRQHRQMAVALRNGFYDELAFVRRTITEYPPSE